MTSSYGFVVLLLIMLSYKRNTPFFPTDPKQLWTEGISNCATTLTKEDHAAQPRANTGMLATTITASGHTQVTNAPNSPVQAVDPAQKEKTTPQADLSSNITATVSNNVTETGESVNIEPTVVTPIEANRLKLALANHPDKLFADRLCSELQHGAHIGYEGPCAPRSSKNLPSATANPSVIDENLGKEVALGRTAGPFASPPLKNFQVSPIGLVPKKHSGKFCTIFHLSHRKSGNSITHI